MSEDDLLSTDETTSSVDGDDEGDLILASDTPKITLDKNDRSLAEFYRWYQKGRIIVDPEWQRRYVWDNRRASKLIESFLLCRKPVVAQS